jgi:hypothetical protein
MRNSLTRVAIGLLTASALALLAATPGTADMGGIHGSDAVVSEEGQKAIGKPDLPARCGLEPDGGSCKGLFFEYYYDPKTKQCREFVYGGCGGRVPFETEEECRRVCGPKN